MRIKINVWNLTKSAEVNQDFNAAVLVIKETIKRLRGDCLVQSGDHVLVFRALDHH